MSHRVHLQIGIEPEFTNKGFGKKLTNLAIEWVKNETSIEWIDLSVFSNNMPALKLYKTYGFIEIEKIDDYFRIYDQKITNISMTLRIIRED